MIVQFKWVLGMIKTYFGPMGASKTKTLLDEYEKIYFKDRILVFSPVKDDRFGVGKIKERDTILKDGSIIRGREIDSIAIEDFFEIEKHLSLTTKHVFIDEVNFFESEEDEDKGKTLYELEKRRYESMRLLLKLSLEKKINFYLFGLNLTAEMMPYGLMPAAIAYSTEPPEVLSAECIDCGDIAHYTFYIPFEKETNVIGADDYCALCGPCHFKWEGIYKELKSENNLEEYFRLAKVLKPYK